MWQNVQSHFFSRTPPVEEVIRDGENGLLVDFHAPAKLAARVEEAVKNNDYFRALRAQARATVVERYDWRTVCRPQQVALIESLATSAWATVTSGDALSLAQRAHLRAAGVWAVERAIGVAQVAYRAGGGGAVYDDSSLQRRLRDVETLAQHFLVRLDTLTTAGAVLTGHELDVPVF